MSIDKKSLIIGILLGVFVGLLISYFVVLHSIEVIGTAFKVENMNMTVALNETMMKEMMQQAINQNREALNQTLEAINRSKVT